MKKIYFLILPIFLGIFSSCLSKDTSLVVDSTIVLIPDTAFENALISQQIDSDGQVNGKIKKTDAELVTALNVSKTTIYSLAGIEGFINLTYLDCSSNNLSTIDIRGLTNLQAFDCSSNQLTTLDLSKNINLAGLNCLNNQLKNLTIAGKQLYGVNCSNNLLQTITLTDCPKLTVLTISKNNLTELNLTLNTNLMELHCDFNKIKSIDLSQNTKLSYLDISNNAITALNLCANTAIIKLFSSTNNLNTIFVPADNLVNLRNNNSILDTQTSLVACP